MAILCMGYEHVLASMCAVLSREWYGPLNTKLLHDYMFYSEVRKDNMPQTVKG